MNEEIGTRYPFAEMARAFVTALTHEDPATRERAEGRVAQWRAVLEGMASGRLRIGSRTPVKDLPAWVTPEVVRGGFATGAAASGGGLQMWERPIAREAGVEPTRRALFAHYLSEPGLAQLDAMLSTGRYTIDVPEEAALPVVAWLVAAGETEGALALTEEIAPFGDRLRFAPKPYKLHDAHPDVVFRDTAGNARRRLEDRRPNERVETMREALTVWNPFADELLSLWLETEGGARFPDGWHDRARALLERYQELSRAHTRSRKHRNPKENLAVLLRATATVVAGHELEPRQAGLLRVAIESMVARRGAPGSARHRELRDRQAADAALPGHHLLARVVATRLGELPQARGVDAVEPLLAPVTAAEAARDGILEGTEIPRSIHRVVRRTLAGTPERLIEAGVIPSAEVLAELVPRIAATTVAAAYDDERLRELMAANYMAFRDRRSLLLLNLEHQVRVDELPWVRAVAHHRRDGAGVDELRAALARLAELALDAFPATILPNALVTELDALAREARLDLPLVEELAADIFMGTFSAKFLAAAKLAARLLQGGLYERYYGIDYAAVLAIDDVRKHGRGAATSRVFDRMCEERAGHRPTIGSVAANGAVIEQAQILTTHNLAALTGPFGVGEAVRLDWAALATRSFERQIVLAERLHGNPRPLAMVKDLAYAWRQMVFFLSRLPAEDAAAFAGSASDALRPQPAFVHAALGPALAGLQDVLEGDRFDAAGHSRNGRRLLGWTVGPHWVLAGVSR